jgi:hypothetical protein
LGAWDGNDLYICYGTHGQKLLISRYGNKEEKITSVYVDSVNEPLKNLDYGSFPYVYSLRVAYLIARDLDIL